MVASIIYAKSALATGTGGLAGLTPERASQLQGMALNAIPDDFDAVPTRNLVDAQVNTDLPDIGMLVPRPKRRVGPPVKHWAVAVTTAPRQQATLDSCLTSLQIAGWSNPRLVVDGDVAISPRWSSLPLTHRVPKVGAWPSYYLCLVELLMREPEADAFLIVQDDVVLFQHPNLRTYLESMLWPDSGPGIVSLYCSRAYAKSAAGWHRLDEVLVWGGQALIFPREVALEFVADSRIVRHRFEENGFGLANIDGLIGAWARDTNTPVYVCSPSLAQHIGQVSSLWKDSRAFVNRSAATFAGSVQLGDRERGR